MLMCMRRLRPRRTRVMNVTHVMQGAPICHQSHRLCAWHVVQLDGTGMEDAADVRMYALNCARRHVSFHALVGREDAAVPRTTRLGPLRARNSMLSCKS